MRVTLSGYNRGETLVNFPVFVALSTNLPGFSYGKHLDGFGKDIPGGHTLTKVKTLLASRA